MKVALYARVSTSDKEQNVETQLLPLKEFAEAQGWEIYRTYIDLVSATDLAHRYEWQELLEDASKRRFDLVLLWRMDRGFRSVLDATTLERLRTWGVGLRSYAEPWLDTTSPFGEALYCITIVYAQIELDLIRDRVKAGMDRARRQGRQINRPNATDRRGFSKGFEAILSAFTAVLSHSVRLR